MSGSTRSNGHDKIRCRSQAHVFDAVFVVRADEADGAGSQPRGGVIDGDVHGAFANEPHFRMNVAMWWVRGAAGWKRRLMNLDGFPCGKFSFQNSADCCSCRSMKGQFVVRKHL